RGLGMRAGSSAAEGLADDVIDLSLFSVTGFMWCRTRWCLQRYFAFLLLFVFRSQSEKRTTDEKKELLNPALQSLGQAAVSGQQLGRRACEPAAHARLRG